MMVLQAEITSRFLLLRMIVWSGWAVTGRILIMSLLSLVFKDCGLGDLGDPTR